MISIQNRNSSIQKTFAAYFIGFVFCASAAHARHCEDLFVEKQNRDSELVTYLGGIKGTTEFMVTWFSRNPFTFQDFARLQAEASKRGVTIVTEIEQQASVQEKSPLGGPGFLNAFVFRGDSAKIANLLDNVNFKQARITDFEAVNQKVASHLIGFAALNLTSSRDRRPLVEKFIADHPEKIMIINDLDSRAQFSIVDAKLYSEVFDVSSLRQDARSVDEVFANWPVVANALQRGLARHLYVIDPIGRDFILMSLPVIQTLLLKIEERNGLIEQMVTARVTTNQSLDSRTDLTLEDFVRNPQSGRAEFKVLHLDNQRRYYVINPFWFGRTTAREILKALEEKNPNYPAVSQSARNSLSTLSNGRGVDGQSYLDRSYWSLTGPSVAEGLREDHARDLAVAITRREPIGEQHQKTRLRLHYILIPIPIGAQPSVPSVQPVDANKRSVRMRSTSAAKRASETGPVLAYATFQNNRATLLASGGGLPLESEKVIGLKSGGSMNFYVIDPTFIRNASTDEIATYIQNRYPDSPLLSTRNRKFVDALKAGSLSSVNYRKHSPTELGQSMMREYLSSAYDAAAPIVLASKKAPDDIILVMLPVRADKATPATSSVAAPKATETTKDIATDAAKGSVNVTSDDGISVAEFILRRARAIGSDGHHPLNSSNPVRVVQKRGVDYFYVVHPKFLQTAAPGAVEAWIKKQFPTRSPLSKSAIAFVEAARLGSMSGAPHAVHSIGSLSGQGTSGILEAAWRKDIPIVAKRVSTGSEEIEYVLIPIRKSAK